MDNKYFAELGKYHFLKNHATIHAATLDSARLGLEIMLDGVKKGRKLDVDTSLKFLGHIEKAQGLLTNCRSCANQIADSLGLERI